MDSENAARDITSTITVLTHTPDASNATWCQGYIELGYGPRYLDGTGGNFELVVTIGGQTVQPSPQIIVFETEAFSAIWTTPFPVPANAEVILRIKSPNVADSDVAIMAYLYDCSPQVDANSRVNIASTGLDSVSITTGDIKTLYDNAHCAARTRY